VFNTPALLDSKDNYMNATTVSDATSKLPAAVKERFSTRVIWPRINGIASRIGIGALIIAACVTGVIFGERYWSIGRFVQSTDDAYVQADSPTIAPKVSGYVAGILVNDNQTVKAGQVLALIDDRDLRTALDEANASVSAAAASVANLSAQLAAQDSTINQAEANAAAARTALGLAARNEARRREMANVGYGSLEQSDDASADRLEKSALLRRETAAVMTAHRQIEVLKAQKNLAEAELARAQALQHQAELNVSYATIRAPIDGSVAARSIRVGQYVQAGTQLMALVPLTETYVIANFKETQLTHMRAGQIAWIKVDAFPNDDLAAHIESLAPASGMEFSLLPPDNATGNFTKIVQRVPVKIAIDSGRVAGSLLRPGMSVDVSVDTKEGKAGGRQLASRG
jgi:membrane fusion protein, multidrug efflux system